MKKFLLFLSAVMALAVCDDAELQRQFKTGNDAFTSKMFAEVVKLNPGKSVVLSAYSVLNPLATLSLASSGVSHEQLLKAIGLPSDNVTRAVFPLVNKQLQQVKGVELKTASKIYIPETYELNEAFATDIKSVFDSDVKKVNFAKSEEAAKEINAWVEDQTNHRIKDLVDPSSLDDLTRAVLVNAIYFKGSWKEKFNKDATKEQDFYVSKDSKVKVPMMQKLADYKYGESKELDAKLLELPYEGDETSFLVVLPNEIDGLPALQEKLKNPEVLSKAISEMFTVEVQVYLPKFKIETTTDLKEVLQKMEVTHIFDESKAGLDHLLKTKESIFVSKAIQKAFIEVNEEGAEAAAANAFGIVATSAIINPKKYYFNADHPFAFFLKEGENDIFTGLYAS